MTKPHQHVEDEHDDCPLCRGEWPDGLVEELLAADQQAPVMRMTKAEALAWLDSL
jgi:Zn-finger nucleic acid-binding protein